MINTKKDEEIVLSYAYYINRSVILACVIVGIKGRE